MNFSNSVAEYIYNLADTEEEGLSYEEWEAKLKLQKSALRLESCGEKVTYACEDCHKTYYFPNNCNCYRVCPTCAKKQGLKMYKKYVDIVKNFRYPALLTLNVKNYDNLTPDAFRKFRSDFSKLRRRTPFMNYNKKKKKMVPHVKGGIYSFEVKFTESGWNLHLHALIDSQWLFNSVENPKSLKSNWAQVTTKQNHDFAVRFWNGELTEKEKELIKPGAGFSSHVKRAGSPKKGLNYVLKYVFKPFNYDDVPAWVPALYFEATRGQRLVQTFGSAFDAIDQTIYPALCKDCGGFLKLSTLEETEQQDREYFSYDEDPPPKTDGWSLDPAQPFGRGEMPW